MSTNELSPAKDFQLTRMADDLLTYTLQMVGKKEDKNPRFPRLLYDGYVSNIVLAATTIQKDIILANEHPIGKERAEYQVDAMGNCMWLNHLLRIAREQGWISERQCNSWQQLTTGIRWKTFYWKKSDNQIKK